MLPWSFSYLHRSACLTAQRRQRLVRSIPEFGCELQVNLGVVMSAENQLGEQGCWRRCWRNGRKPRESRGDYLEVGFVNPFGIRSGDRTFNSAERRICLLV